MSVWRLSALSSGTSAKVGPALLPVPAVDAGAKNSREKVFGYPAIVIPAPTPLPISGQSAIAQTLYGPASGGMGLPGAVTPFWRPSIYWVNSHERAPVSRISDNQMPVPAIDPRGLPGTAGGLASARNVREGIVMPGALFRGQYQVTQPRVAPKFANFNRPGKKKPRA